MQLVAGRCQRRRQAALLVAPGVAVGVVGEQAADHLVGRRAVPQREERRDDVLQAPEELIGPVEAFGRIALAAEEIRLPRAVGGDAGHLVDLGLVGHRIGGVGRARGRPSDRPCRAGSVRRRLRPRGCRSTGCPWRRSRPCRSCRRFAGPSTRMPRTCRGCSVSASPKPASGPVRGLTWPILMTLACALAELALSSAGMAMAAAPDLMSVRRFKRLLSCHSRLLHASGVSSRAPSSDAARPWPAAPPAVPATTCGNPRRS